MTTANTPTPIQLSASPLTLPIDMPDAAPQLARILAYGKAKTRKTWWSGTASATHRVIILDGENGTGILSMIPADQRHRITRIPLTTRVNRPSMAMFCALMFKTQRFIWSIADEAAVQLSQIQPQQWYISVNINNLTDNDVLIIDSWTKLTADTAMQYMTENSIDPYAGKKRDFDHYGYQDLVLDAMLANINCIPSHLIILGHEQYYKFEVREGLTKREMTRVQVISSTGKHASKLPAALSDVLWFEASNPPTNAASVNNSGFTYIYTGATEYRDGGARSVPPGRYQFPGWEWRNYAEAAKLRLPTPDDLATPQTAFVAMLGSDLIASFAQPAPTAQPAPAPTTQPAAGVAGAARPPLATSSTSAPRSPLFSGLKR